MALKIGNQSEKFASKAFDASDILTHLVREYDCRKDESVRDTKTAKQILLSILGSKGRRELIASGTGFYSAFTPQHYPIYKPSARAFDADFNIRAVCFTETPLEGLAARRDLYKANYGLSFQRKFLFSRGANPCLNIRNDLLKLTLDCSETPNKLFNFIPEALTPFVNVINEAFDSTHEREWRHVGNLDFSISDVVSIYAPPEDWPEFMALGYGITIMQDLAEVGATESVGAL